MLLSLINNARSAIYVKGLDGYFKLVNRQFCELVGKNEAEVIGKTSFDLFPAELAEQHVARDTEVVQTGRYLEFNDLREMADGGHDFRASKFPIFDAEGAIVAIGGISTDTTMHIRREKELRLSEERFRLAFHTSPDSINLNRVEDGLYLDINEGFTDLTGYTREDVIGKSSLAISIWNDIEDRQRLVQGLQQSGFVKNLEAEFVRKDGEIRVGLMSARILSIHGESVILSVTRDITERKAAEEALRSSEEQLRMLLEQVDAIIWTVDRKQCFTSSRGAGLVKIGLLTDEVVGRSAKEFLENENLPSPTAEAIPRVLKGHSVTRYEEFGGFYWESHLEPLRGAEDEIVGCVSVSLDITARRRTERALKESEAKFRQLFQRAPVMLHNADPQGHLIEVNDRWLNTMGYRREEVLGKSPVDFLTDESKQVAKNEVIPRFYRDGYIHDQPYRMVKKGGEVIDVLLTAFADEDAEGRYVRSSVSIVDVTERKQAEVERAKLEQKLIQTQKLEAIGRLAGGVAHDLNNLLSPILGYGELLLADTAPHDPRRTKLAQIRKAGLGARDLVRQLLAFSRKQTLEFNLVDLNATLTGFEKLLRRTIREDIEIRIIAAPRLRPVKADIGQIEQVIMNLTVNASDAMPDGGRLTIETAEVVLDETFVKAHQGVVTGEYAMLAVSDTGCGMDADTRGKIFEPFFSTKGRQGTGLGLATVYGIVKQHRGNIWVYSEPGQGTTFKVFLPISGETVAKRVATVKPEGMVGGSETVLLVEDNEQVCEIVNEILERQGYKVLVAVGGPQALELLAAHDIAIDLLLTDVIMPDMNGKQLYDQVQSQHPTLKVLYMSGYTNNVIAHHGVLDESVQFIQKPFTTEALATKVREVLDNG